jgi:glutamate-1-semialdehyde 2,1-aminomutase
VILICGYSGWHDWFLAANLGAEDALRGHLLPGLAPLGVPRELRGTTLAFHMNDRAELDAALAQAGSRLAAVVMEPCRSADPEPGFLAYVRDRAHAAGGLLAFDEVSIGWRRFYGGAHMRLGIEPDIAFFSKALGNGHPIGAVIGTRAAMEGAAASFISSTYWTEGVGPAAALATLEEMRRTDVPAHVEAIGARTMGHWRKAAAETGLPVEVPDGYPCLAHFSFRHPQGEALRTLFAQLMLERGFLAATGFYPTLAHDDEVVDRYGEAVREVFGEIARALAAGDVERRLKGPVAHSGFRRLL